MGVMYEYFSAPSDDVAAAVINRPGGPGSQEALVDKPQEPRRRWLRSPSAPQLELVRDPDLPVFDLLAAKGIDPVVQLGTLEECLTGRPWDEIVDDALSGYTVASRDDGGMLVVSLTDSLVHALAGASVQQLAAAAVPWSQTEEFWEGDPDILTGFLSDLAELARRAQSQGYRLYCWVCV